MEQQSVKVQVYGIVQGVGFRPFVYRLASRYTLRGSITNTSTGVIIRAGGVRDRLEAFVRALDCEAPPLAVITSFVCEPLAEPVVEDDFVILESEAEERPTTLISPDISVCDDCLAEITDPADPRFGYPFTNCTNCGPRFTIISGLPYDRPQTSMAAFPMCENCRQEYEDPADRRFHAQPNACPVCGPKLVLHDAGGMPLPAEDCIGYVARALRDGRIVAIKGLGGFHLCVDGCSESAVRRLRRRKHRYAKPLAVMVRDVETARKYCRLDDLEADLLTSMQRPIVLVRKHCLTELADDVAPGIIEVGIMLPYTPLHYLLLAHPDTPEVLVMTSGNLSEEPICTENDDALTRLDGIADLFLLHNRDIVTRVDDSVARVVDGRVQMIRRSRGFAPMPVLLREQLPELLACGAELKSTFCLTREDKGFMGQHIGDLSGPKNLAFYEESVNHFQQVFEVEPTAVVCDLHPDYLSTTFARRYAADHSLPLLQVQHHHAHAAAVMAEHGLDDVLAVVFDGAGYGPDKTVWGGEFLRVERDGYQRLGHLSCFQLPGGDAAAREPWRVALSLLRNSFNGSLPSRLPETWESFPADKLSILLQMMDKGINSPLTSSCGRLFDGVAALMGVRTHSLYEGQAAMELEGLAWCVAGGCSAEFPDLVRQRYNITILEDQGMWTVDHRPMVRQLLQDVMNGVEKEKIACAFHTWLAVSSYALLDKCVLKTGINNVVLSGGCMQNRLLLMLLSHLLEQDGFAVYTGEHVPVNDGGIALGQACIGGRWLKSGNLHPELVH